MNRSIRHMAGLLLAAGLALAACTTAATPVPAAGGGGGLTVATGNSAALGVFLTGAGGKTLYLLTKDSANTSTCAGSCATNWPPLTVPAGGAGVTPGAGVTGTFSTFARADGSMQVAINGKPLYYFSGDNKAGDTNGQGQGGVWFVAAPDGGGAPAGSPPAGGSPSAEPTKPGYNY
jgi:predicted lipoprotein with Yx(FWY)xxD motif